MPFMSFRAEAGGYFDLDGYASKLCGHLMIHIICVQSLSVSDNYWAGSSPCSDLVRDLKFSLEQRILDQRK